MSKKWMPDNPERTLSEMIVMFNQAIKDNLEMIKSRNKVVIVYDMSGDQCNVSILHNNISIWSYGSLVPNNRDKAISNACAYLTFSLLQGSVVLPFEGKAIKLLS